MTQPEFIDVEETVALVKSATCLFHEVGHTAARLFGEMSLQFPEVETVSAPMVVYTKWSDGLCEIEAGFPVDPLSYRGPTHVLKTYPACTAIFATHAGPFDRLPESWMALWTFVRTNNIDVTGPTWELYVKPPIPGPNDAMTELYIPLRSY